MRRLIIGAFIVGMTLAGGYAAAQIVSGLPFVLQNDTLADATQVMANFNQIVNNVNSNSAKNGANNDITSLNALSTPISPAQGGTTTFTATAPSTGTNNQAVAATVPAVFNAVLGNRVVFVAGFSNTGQTSLNVNGTGAVEVLRPSQIGPVSLVGGEIRAGQVIEVVYSGTRYQLVGTPDHIGAVSDTVETAAPAGWALADGSCISQTGTGASLFTLASTSWGACGAGAFALPDLRGRTAIAPDAGANRVTNAGSGCTAVLMTGCGAQNQSFTLAQGNLPSYTLPNTLGINNTMSVSNGTLAASNGTLAASNGTLAINNTMAADNGTLAISNTMGVSDTRTWITSNSLLASGGATAPGAGALTAAATSQSNVVVNSGAISLTGGTSLTGAVTLTGGTSLTGATALTGAVSLTGAVALAGGTTITGSVTSGGSGTAVTVTTLQPTLVVNKIIKL